MMVGLAAVTVTVTAGLGFLALRQVTRILVEQQDQR